MTRRRDQADRPQKAVFFYALAGSVVLSLLTSYLYGQFLLIPVFLVLSFALLVNGIINFNVLIVVYMLFIPLYPKVPLIPVGGTFIPVRLDDWFISVILLAWLIKYKPTLRRLVDTPLFWPFLIFEGSLLLSLVVNVLFSELKLFPGVFFFIKTIQYFLLYLIFYDTTSNFKQIRMLANLLIVGGVLVAVYGLLEKLKIIGSLVVYEWVHTPEFQRIVATAGDQNQLAAYLGIVLILGICLVLYSENRTEKIRVTAGCLLVLIAFVYTLSLGAFAGLFAALIMIGLVKEKRILFLAPALIAVAYLLPEVADFTQGRFADTRSISLLGLELPLSYTLSMRLYDTWPTALSEVFRQNPLLGGGPFVAGEGLDGMYAKLLAEGGLLGLTLFLVLLAALFRSGKAAFLKFSNRPEQGVPLAFVAAALALSINAVTNDVWYGSKVVEIYWVLGGAAMAMWKKNMELTNDSATIKAG